MDNNVFGAPCLHTSDCNKHIKHSYCSGKNVCTCKDEYRYNIFNNECTRIKNYGEKCSPTDDCYQEYLICSPFGFCTCSPGYYFNSNQKPYCQLFQSINNTGFLNRHCESGFFWSTKKQRCVKARPGYHGDYDEWMHNHHSMIRPRYSFFTFTIIIICLMIILKRRSRKPSTLQVPRIYNQSIVANEINLNQLRSPILFSTNCYESRRQSQRNQNNVNDISIHPNVQPPPPYEETANYNISNIVGNTSVSATTITITDSPPSYEQAIKMQSIQQPVANTVEATAINMNSQFTPSFSEETNQQSNPITSQTDNSPPK